ncbi:hypothetical protein F0562_030744 [Nyssa sinensis]|uniref:Uncharacterized protein n=1 Tax=Nyssa sinensis TaxID=561372 RepID=A0A5J5AZ96_9ASTE|nr:hypothetical protein F0562_030744 [Nyssa sinensis]
MDGELHLQVQWTMQKPCRDISPPNLQFMMEFNPRSNEGSVASTSHDIYSERILRYTAVLDSSMDGELCLQVQLMQIPRHHVFPPFNPRSNGGTVATRSQNCTHIFVFPLNKNPRSTLIDSSIRTLQVLGVASNISLSDNARLNPSPFISVSCNAEEYLKQTARGKPEEITISVFISKLYTPLPMGDLPGSSVLIEALVSAARNVQATLVEQLLSMDPFHPRAMVQEANPVLKFLENCPINVVAFREAIKNYIVTSYELALAQGDQSAGFSVVLEEARLHVESLTLKRSNLNDRVLESKSGLEHTRLEIEHCETQLIDLRSRHQKERLALGEIKRNLDRTTQELFDVKKSLDDLSDHLKMLEKAVDNTRNELCFR